ncbi:hypothetical protein MKZ38_001036 [Zalerion maritima]|uniref:Uncharacterized protein n=1 Tax=Zalerion maritima TaxID=339359 RepID=A0AAD5WTE3_9PEZI|nr:hypothetical protein MKZ38_001036 [Zalerion maritima]
MADFAAAMAGCRSVLELAQKATREISACNTMEQHMGPELANIQGIVFARKTSSAPASPQQQMRILADSPPGRSEAPIRSSRQDPAPHFGPISFILSTQADAVWVVFLHQHWTGEIVTTHLAGPELRSRNFGGDHTTASHNKFDVLERPPH